jgi:hypothetical protein
MAGFRRVELHRRRGAERVAELLAALPLASRAAVDEGEVLVRLGAVLVVQPDLEGGRERLRRSLVVAGVELA